MATLKEVCELLTVVDGLNLPFGQVRKHLELVGQRGLCAEQHQLLLGSPRFPELLEAARLGTLGEADEVVYRHLFKLPPKDAESERADSLTATFSVNTSRPSWPGEWTEEKGWKAAHRGLGKVEVTFRNGEMYVNGVKVVPYLSPEQERGNVIGGKKLEKLRLADTGRPDLPDPLLNLVLREQDNPAVAAWLRKYEGKHPWFWGTVYESLNGIRIVRYLGRYFRRWDSSRGRLDGGVRRSHPALVLECPLDA